MSCEEVRELLPEHLLGALEEDAERAVSRHLRGCGRCRAELASLGQGLATFARAAHQSEPPPDLRDRVLAVLEEEQAEAPVVIPFRRRFAGTFLAQAALVVALAGALAWGTVATVAGSHASAGAGRYQAFLSALGGKDVRVATITSTHPRAVEGSAVVYDSDVGQSWALILARSPGLTGRVRVFLSSPSDRIELRPLRFDSHGEASTWLVSSANLARYDHVRLVDQQGRTLASVPIRSD
jgi:anti-sigma factor RsiW